MIWAHSREDLEGHEDALPWAPLSDDGFVFPHVDWPVLTVHPMHLIDDDCQVVFELWQAYAGGLAPGPLPEPDRGVDRQAACVMDAFRILSAMDAHLRRKDKVDR